MFDANFIFSNEYGLGLVKLPNPNFKVCRAYLVFLHKLRGRNRMYNILFITYQEKGKRAIYLLLTRDV